MLLWLSGAAPVSVVLSPDLWNRYHAPLFRWFHRMNLYGLAAEASMASICSVTKHTEIAKPFEEHDERILDAREMRNQTSGEITIRRG
jgi:hypothetical protein